MHGSAAETIMATHGKPMATIMATHDNYHGNPMHGSAAETIRHQHVCAMAWQRRLELPVVQ